MRLLALCAALGLAGAAGATAAPPRYTPALNARVLDKASSLVEAHYWNRDALGARWAEVRDRYRDRIVAAPDRRAFYTLLGEMLDQLGDSHVFAIDPVQVALGRARDRGQALGGFGLAMLPDRAGAWRVQSLRADGPAATAGVQIGWELRAVDGQPFDIDFQPAEGQPARMRFVDEEERPHDLVLAAVLERQPSPRRATMLPGGILLIGLDGFDPGADGWMRAAIEEHGPRAVILDLRGNDGGDADVIARVGGLFFAERRLLVRRIGGRESDQMTRGAGGGAWTGPLAVLIGPDSASGAEAVAALIDESGRGITVGQRTAGALTGAELFRLPDGGQLSVAEFDIRTAGGRRLEGVGLAPRIAVAPTLAQRRAGQDPVLDKARALLAPEIARR